MQIVRWLKKRYLLHSPDWTTLGSKRQWNVKEVCCWATPEAHPQGLWCESSETRWCHCMQPLTDWIPLCYEHKWHICIQRERERVTIQWNQKVVCDRVYLFDNNQKKKQGIIPQPVWVWFSNSVNVLICVLAFVNLQKAKFWTFKTLTLGIYIKDVITYILYIQAHLPRKRTCYCIFLCSHFAFIRSKVHSWGQCRAVI